MVDGNDKVVIIDVDGIDQVLFKTTDDNWHLDISMDDFNYLITQLGSVEVNGVKESNILTFTVGEVNYSFNTNTSVITPALEVE